MKVQFGSNFKKEMYIRDQIENIMKLYGGKGQLLRTRNFFKVVVV